MNDDVYYHSYLNRDRLIQIIDHDASTCEALSVLFKMEGYQTAYALDTQGLFSSRPHRHPDIVVLNIDLENGEGMTALRRLKAMHTCTPVFMIADRPNLDLAVAAMKAGANDVLAKPIDTERLVRAVRDALRQDVHVGAVQGGRRPIEIRGFNQLTPREREVLQLITNGQSNKEAGRELGISPRTVEVHRARVMEKLGARNTADLMRIVLTT